MKKIKFLVLFCAVFLFANTVSAEEIEHFTTKAGDEIALEDIYNSSVVAAGESIEITGTIKGIAITAGNKIALKGTSDYSILAGNSIEIEGTVNNDSFIAGNIITTEDSSLFQRDIIIAGSDVELNGTFNRNVSVYGNKVTVKDANIKGNLKVYSERINVKKDANIIGTLSYPEDSIYKVSKDADIGDTQKTPAIKTVDEENYLDTVSGKFFSFLCLAVVFAAISLFIPNALNNINDKYEKFEFSEAVEVFTKGLVIIIIVPVISILLCCTLIGVPLGIILLLLYGISIYVSTVFTAYLIGYKIWQKFFDKDAHVLFFGLIGLFILLILNLIPGIRILVSMITILVGLGLIFDIIKK